MLLTRLHCCQVVRCLPWVVQNYNLDELTSVSQLRSNISKLFKLNANMQNPAVRPCPLGRQATASSHGATGYLHESPSAGR